MAANTAGASQLIDRMANDAQFRESGLPELSAQLELTIQDGEDGRPMPARIYLFKDDRPFRLSPVDALLPLKVDLSAGPNWLDVQDVA